MILVIDTGWLLLPGLMSLAGPCAEGSGSGMEPVEGGWGFEVEDVGRYRWRTQMSVLAALLLPTQPCMQGG